MEPLYQGEPILAVAAVDELTAAEAIEKIRIEFEPLPFVVDPLDSCGPAARIRARTATSGCSSDTAGVAGAATGPPPARSETQVDRGGFCRGQARPPADGKGAR